MLVFVVIIVKWVIVYNESKVLGDIEVSLIY